MMTTIMSAIVYSHYVEALTPGTFQHNMSEMFKLNGLKPVNFPTPPMNDIVIQACKDVFGTNKQTNDNDRQTFEQDIQTPSTSDYRQTETDDLSMQNLDLDSNKEESNKRMRKSLTPPPPPHTEMTKDPKKMGNLFLQIHQNLLRNKQTKMRVYLKGKWEQQEGEEGKQGRGDRDLVTHPPLQMMKIEHVKLV